MKNETVAVHGGYDTDPTTKAVAVPIYQTVAYEFDSADHGAALFNLEVEGYRYSRISNPTTAVLERRVARSKAASMRCASSTGQAALNYAVLNLTAMGTNIVSVPQLYGTTHTLFGHVLPSQGITVRFAESDRPDAIEKLIDDNTRAIFCESVGNPAGNICDIEALAAVAERHGVPLVVDNTVATPILLRPIDYGADIVVHSLTKFMGGHGTTLGGAIVDSGKFPWKQHAQALSDVQRAGRFLSRADLCRSFRRGRLYRALPQRLSAHHRRGALAAVRLSVAARHRDGRAAGRAPCRECAPRRRIPAHSTRGSTGSITPASPIIPITRWREKYLGGRACSLLTFGIAGRARSRQGVLRRAAAVQAAGQHGRRQIARLPSGLDHAPADVGGGTAQGRREAGNDPARPSASSTSTTSSPISIRRWRRRSRRARR